VLIVSFGDKRHRITIRDLSPYVVSFVLRKALTEAYLQCFRNTLPTSLAQNTFRRKLFLMAVCLTCLGLSGGLDSARQLRGTIWALIIHLRAAQNRAWQNSSFEWGGGRGCSLTTPSKHAVLGTSRDPRSTFSTATK